MEERYILRVAMPRSVEAGGSGKSETILMGYPVNRVSKKSGAYWAVEALQTGMTPDGNELRPCVWHTGYDGNVKDKVKNPNDPKRCIVTPIPTYGIWLSQYECLDTCWIDSEEQRQKSLAESRANNLLIETFDQWAPESVAMHKDFLEKVQKSHKLRTERDRVQKELAKLVQGPDLKSPQYQALQELKTRAENQLIWAKGQAETFWRPESNLTLEQYVQSRTGQAISELEKATEKLNNWVNRGAVQKSKILEVSDNLKMLQSELAAIDANIRNTVKLPFYFTRRAYNQLNKLRWFINNWMCYKQTGAQKAKIEIQIEEYLAEITTGLNLYTEWIPLSDQDSVYDQVHKEQEEAAAAEANQKVRAMRDLENQQTAVLGEFIIDLDGTAVEVAAAHDAAPVEPDLSIDLDDMPKMSAGRRLKMLQLEASQPKQVLTLQGKISLTTDASQMTINALAGELEQYDRDEQEEEDWRASSDRYHNPYDNYADRSGGGKARSRRGGR